MHRATSRFWKCLEDLPPKVQKVAERKFEILRNNPSHPSLHFKRIGKLWSARIDRNHRALALADGGDFIWIWIGTHDEYERIIKDHSL